MSIFENLGYFWILKKWKNYLGFLVVDFCIIYDNESLRKVDTKLSTENLTTDLILETIRDINIYIYSQEDDIREESNGISINNVEKDLKEKYKKLLTEWSALLSSIIEKDIE